MTTTTTTNHSPIAAAVRAHIKPGDALRGRFYCSKRHQTVRFARWDNDQSLTFWTECGSRMFFEDVSSVNGTSPLMSLVFAEIDSAHSVPPHPEHA